jgi:hypothetical protein
MTERISSIGSIGISLVLLIIAMAHLLTDVVRLALEVAPPPGINNAAPAPARFVEPEMPRPPPPAPEQPEQPAGPAASWASAPPRAKPTRRMPVHRMFDPLPADFSINQAPWCRACRPRDPRRHQRRHRDEW